MTPTRLGLPHPLERCGDGLRVWRLTKRYGAHRAVEALDLHVAPGTCLGLLGPNGAGKSTTLSMLAGVLAPDAGTITYGNETDPTSYSVRRAVGFVPQSIALYQDLSAEENLRLFARLQGVDRKQLEERVRSGLSLAGLSEHRDRRVRSFSGGMQRRLNLACATVHEPRYLLLDEPTVGVDPHSREHIFTAIEHFKSAGITLVYSTHYMEEAERLCDRIAVVDHGRLVGEGTKDELLKLHGGSFCVEAELRSKPSLRIAGSESDFGRPEPSGVRKVTFQCDAATDVLPRLLREAGELNELTVRRPTLETVFLALTGRRLRD